ncbi:MAG: helix-turn-helix domain-containing protein [Gammaproteobacteria bacterium]
MAAKQKKKPLDDKSRIAERLKQTRESLSLTQQQLAKKVGISRSAIVHYEQGNVIPGGPELIGLAKALRITPNYILSGKAGFFDSTEPQHVLAVTDADPRVRMAHTAICLGALDREVSESISALIMTLVKAKLSKTEYAEFTKIMATVRETMGDVIPEAEAIVNRKEAEGAFDHLIKKTRKPKKS